MPANCLKRTTTRLPLDTKDQVGLFPQDSPNDYVRPSTWHSTGIRASNWIIETVVSYERVCGMSDQSAHAVSVPDNFSGKQRATRKSHRRLLVLCVTALSEARERLSLLTQLSVPFLCVRICAPTCALLTYLYLSIYLSYLPNSRGFEATRWYQVSWNFVKTCNLFENCIPIL